jgi:hypothetical protein
VATTIGVLLVPIIQDFCHIFVNYVGTGAAAIVVSPWKYESSLEGVAVRERGIQS